jgi:hypothetical protein
MKRTTLLFVLLAALSSLLAVPAPAGRIELKVRVIAQVANIRSADNIASPVIQTAKAGTVFTVIRTTGEWYLIGTPGAGQGYIHRSVVEEIADPTARPEAPQVPQIQPKPAAPPAPDPGPARPTAASEPKLFLRAGYNIGFAESTNSLSFSRAAYYETSTFGLNYALKKGNSIDAAVGYMLGRSLGIEVGASLTSRNMDETTSLSVPHPLWMDYPRTGTLAGSGLSLSETDIYLNLVYTIRFSMFGISLYGGPCYIMAAATVVSDVATSETGYPYMEMNASQPTTKIKQNVFGFDGGAALSIHLGRSIALVLDARYVSGTGAFKPESDVPELKLSLGGLRAGGGFKLSF